MNALPYNQKASNQLERAYLKNKHGQSYIACENLEFLWTKEEVNDFKRQWRHGASLQELSQYFNRTQEEVLILALDLGMKKRIHPRRGGLIGCIEG